MGIYFNEDPFSRISMWNHRKELYVYFPRLFYSSHNQARKDIQNFVWVTKLGTLATGTKHS